MQNTTYLVHRVHKGRFTSKANFIFPKAPFITLKVVNKFSLIKVRCSLTFLYALAQSNIRANKHVLIYFRLEHWVQSYEIYLIDNYILKMFKEEPSTFQWGFESPIRRLLKLNLTIWSALILAWAITRLFLTSLHLMTLVP